MKISILVLSLAVAMSLCACSAPDIEPKTIPTSALASTQTESPRQTQAPSSTPIPKIVDSSQYPYGSLESRIGPGAGECYFEPNVQTAMADEANSDSLFHVIIFIGEPGHDSGEYVYNGRTMSQWRVLVALANETYPYGEYNGDHGGNIAKEEFYRRQEESKTLNAQENLSAAIVEYTALGRQEAMYKSEYERLAALGLGMEQPEEGVLIGLLTKAQLTDFPAHESYGYAFHWASFYFDEIRE